jgi:hypothetical protein
LSGQKRDLKGVDVWHPRDLISLAVDSITQGFRADRKFMFFDQQAIDLDL